MTGKPRTAVEDGPEGVRERILAAAMELLRESGIRALSQVQVARRAKVRQSHLTYYFPRRHDLIEAVATRFIEHAFGSVATAAAEAAPDELAAVLRQTAAAVAEEGHMRMFVGVIIAADDDTELREIIAGLTKQLQSRLAQRLGGSDATERARFVLASLWGMGLYDFLIRPRRKPQLPTTLLDCLVPPTRGSRSRE
ncbi:MAG TPA: TetR family transcriptional regulator [Gemmatimonadaceae bacterium]|nr:TetR family transcriptional regulator [Gemmatimonadaceae bacterium]